MTTYLWYSAEQERKSGGHGEKRAFVDSFNNRSSKPSVGFNVYLDAVGEPVKVTQVTSSPEHDTKFADIRLLDAVEQTECLTSNSGQLQEAAYEFCRRKEIEPDYFALMRYIYATDQNTTFLRRNLPVQKPLALKK